MNTMATALAAGCSYQQLANILGVKRDTARMRAVRAGLRSLHRKRPPNPETADRLRIALGMKDQGHDAHAMAERLGMTVAAVRMMLRRAV